MNGGWANTRTMTPDEVAAWTAAQTLSRDLATEIGQLPVVRRVSENVVEVRSRNVKTPDVWYQVTRGLDGSLVCSCAASFYPYRSECWHLQKAKKEFAMTTETRALVPIVVKPSAALLPSSHDLDVVERAAAMAYAGAVALPAELNSPAKVAAVMLYGLELGLRPMTSIRHLYIVKGRVSPSAELMAGLCMAKERDISFHIEELNAEKCTIRMIRPSRNVNDVMTITWAQIARAGLDQGANKQYPEDRLRYHCMKRLMRAYAQDLLNNLDEGVVLPGIDETAPWRPTVVDNDMYNDGDVPDNVDHETGEIHEATQQAPVSASAGPESGPPVDAPAAPSPALATDEQLAKVTEWTEALKGKGKDATDAVDAARRAEWPSAIVNGRFSAAKLTESQCDEYIALLADAAGPVQQTALV